MPKYGELNKNSKIGDTVSYNGQYYKVINSIESPGKKTIDLNRPINLDGSKGNTQVADTISKLDRSNKYKNEPLGLLQWDKDNPRRAIDETGSVLDKKNVATAVTSQVTEGYASYVQPAFTVALDMLESLESRGKISKDELYNILSPKAKSTDPFLSTSESRVDEWAKKYDPDYFKGTIHDKNIYTSVKNYKKAVNEKGADFFISRTNINRQVKYDKNGRPIAPGKYGSSEDMLSTIPQDWNLEEVDKENYTSQVLDRIATFAKNNYNLSEVENAINSQGLGPAMAAAQIYSMNIQDVKDFRIKAKEKIVNRMYNDLKDQEDIKREFGTPVFDKNNVFKRYDMQNLRFQLDNSFDEAGNFDANYIPYTNYEEALRRKNYNDQKLFGKNYKPVEALPEHLGGREGFINEEDILRSPWIKQEMSQYRTFDKLMGTEPSDIEQRSEEEAFKRGYPMYTDTGAGSYAPDVIPYSETAIGELFSKQFEKTIYNIYRDKDDRNVLGLGDNNIPFFQNIDNKSGIGALGLAKKIKLNAGKNSDALVVWSSFKNDWEDLSDKKINGANRLISFNGLGASAYDDSLGEDEDIGESSEKGIKLINNFIEWLNSTEHKSSEFDLQAYKYAANDFNKTAMVLKFPKKFLKQQVEEGIINETDEELINKNGASVIADQGDFKNDLMVAQKTPLQAHVDYRNSYTWRHPSGLTSYTIEKGGKNSDYNTVARWYGFNEENPGTLKILKEQRNSITNFGSNLDKALNDAILNLTSDVNKMLNQQ
jgi:hypothetical protein